MSILTMRDASLSLFFVGFYGNFKWRNIAKWEAINLWAKLKKMV
jgi:hypothetical protein